MEIQLDEVYNSDKVSDIFNFIKTNTFKIDGGDE